MDIDGRQTTDDRRQTMASDRQRSSIVYRPSSTVLRLPSIVHRPDPLLAAALGMAVFGNLGTVRMIWRGYQALVAPGAVIEGANIFTAGCGASRVSSSPGRGNAAHRHR